jgi:hypothetical protein
MAMIPVGDRRDWSSVDRMLLGSTHGAFAPPQPRRSAFSISPIPPNQTPHVVASPNSSLRSSRSPTPVEV